MIRIEQLTTVVGHGAEGIGTAHQRKAWLSQVPEANSDFAETATAVCDIAYHPAAKIPVEKAICAPPTPPCSNSLPLTRR